MIEESIVNVIHSFIDFVFIEIRLLVLVQLEDIA